MQRKIVGWTCTMMLSCFALSALQAPLAQTSALPVDAAAAAPTLPARQSDDALKALLEERIAQKRGKGFAVALLAPDGSVQFIHAGDSGQPARAQIDGDTIFEIGSITKAFTGILLAQMVERGDVKLADTVRMHASKDINWPAGGAGDITLQQLVTHTSGLPRLPLSTEFIGAMVQEADNPYKHYAREMMWKYLAEREHDATKTYPSEYSNLGIGLLGELLANRAGLSYGELVQRNILDPLGMKSTFIDVPASESARFAKGHNDKLAPAAYWDLPAMGGAGALRSTARDMATFMRAQMTGSLAGARMSHTPLARESERRV
jgi:serine-type D-Ala-D-Ala carboxypeptidase/endopeptidase